MKETNRKLPVSFDTLSDADLVTACIRDPVDQGAWEAFYGRFYSVVSYVVRSKLRDRPNDVSDLVQDCFLHIFKVLSFFNPAKASLKTFISFIARNCVLDYVRKGFKLRSATISLEEETEKFQLRAERDPAFLVMVIEHIAVQNWGEPKAELIRQILRDRKSATIQRELGVSKGAVTDARKWVIDRIREVGYLFPMN